MIQTCVDCPHSAVLGGGICQLTRQTLASHTKTTLPAQSPVLLPFLISHDSPYTLSQAQLIPRSPHLCPPKSLSTPKSPMASCDHPARSNDLLQNSKHLYSCPMQSVLLPLNSPNTVPSASPSTHYILPSAEGIDNPGFLTSSPEGGLLIAPGIPQCHVQVQPGTWSPEMSGGSKSGCVWPHFRIPPVPKQRKKDAQ